MRSLFRSPIKGVGRRQLKFIRRYRQQVRPVRRGQDWTRQRTPKVAARPVVLLVVQTRPRHTLYRPEELTVVYAFLTYRMMRSRARVNGLNRLLPRQIKLKRTPRNASCPDDRA